MHLNPQQHISNIYTVQLQRAFQIQTKKSSLTNTITEFSQFLLCNNIIQIAFVFTGFSQFFLSRCAQNFLVSNQLLIHSLVFNVNSHGKSSPKKVSSDEKCRKFCRKIIFPFDSRCCADKSQKVHSTKNCTPCCEFLRSVGNLFYDSCSSKKEEQEQHNNILQHKESDVMSGARDGRIIKTLKLHCPAHIALIR